MKQQRPYTYLATVQAMCRTCRKITPARVLAEDGAVYQQTICPNCPPRRARIADSIEWYQGRMRQSVRLRPSLAPPIANQDSLIENAQLCHLPVFSITNICNMDCPICFTYNRPDRQYYMPREELRDLLDRLLERTGPLDLINITGGEPTCHPQLTDLLREASRPQIGRITINSNGLRLAQDEDLCRQLADLGVYVILSLHTFDPARSLTIHGRDVTAQKLKTLANLQRFGVGVTLLHVMARGLNDDEFGSVLALARAHSVVRSITVQTMTFTGQGGRSFVPAEHLPLDGAERAIEAASGGVMQPSHFFAHPGAHPLCYSIAYYLRCGDSLRSLTEVLPADELRRFFGDGYLLHLADSGAERLRAEIDRLYAEGAEEAMLKTLRHLILSAYPQGKPAHRFEQQRSAEQHILTVYLHSHMDEDTLDLGRLCVCPDQVPDRHGNLTSACSYNLFHRTKDPRFYCGQTAATGAPHA